VGFGGVAKGLCAILEVAILGTNMLDTHTLIKRLTGAGVPEAQAEAHIGVFLDMSERGFATKADINPIEWKMEGLASDVRILKQDVHVLKQDVSELKQDVSELKQDVSELKQDVCALKQEVNVLKQDVHVLKQDVSELKQEVNVLKQDVHVLKQDVSELKQDVCTLKEDVGELKQDVHVLKQDVHRLKEDVSELKQDVRGLIEDIRGPKGLKVEVAALTLALHGLEGRLLIRLGGLIVALMTVGFTALDLILAH